MSENNIINLFPKENWDSKIEDSSLNSKTILKKIRHALFDDLSFREVWKLMVKPTQDWDPKYALFLIPIIYVLSFALFDLFWWTPLYALYLGTFLNVIVFYWSFRFGLSERKDESEFSEKMSWNIKEAYKKLLEIDHQIKEEEKIKRNKWVSGLKSFDPLVDKLSRITSVAWNVININFRKE